MMGIVHAAVWACCLPVEWTGTLHAEWAGRRLPADRASPASGQGAACQRNGQVSLNAEAAHRLLVEWTGGAPYPQ
jgi:hypothetical protein